MPGEKIKFVIENIDPLGQGVSKIGDKITFIQKTLPGEEGSALVYRKKGNVQFAIPEKWDQLSSERITPECPHFKDCTGCHFLHSNYDNEVNFKKMTMERQFRKWSTPIQVHRAPQRLSYRNRVQLHYDLNLKQLGFIDPRKKTIISVPSCQIPLFEISREIEKLYLNDSWIKLARNFPKRKGHVEISSYNGVVEVNWNKNYAHQGFSQVNQQMNLKLINLIHSKLENTEKVWDLFGGSGNLTAALKNKKVWVVDYGENPAIATHQTFTKINLHSKSALETIHKTQPFAPEVILIDPPRAGFKQFHELIKKWKPQKAIYVSCNPDTLKRDLDQFFESDTEYYQLEELHLLDLFPSTYHFEAVAILDKKDQQ